MHRVVIMIILFFSHFSKVNRQCQVKLNHIMTRLMTQKINTKLLVIKLNKAFHLAGEASLSLQEHNYYELHCFCT